MKTMRRLIKGLLRPARPAGERTEEPRPMAAAPRAVRPRIGERIRLKKRFRRLGSSIKVRSGIAIRETGADGSVRLLGPFFNDPLKKRLGRLRNSIKVRSRVVIAETSADGSVRLLGPFFNDLEATALDEIIKLIAGSNTRPHLDQAHVHLKVLDTQGGSEVGPSWINGDTTEAIDGNGRLTENNVPTVKGAPSAAVQWDFDDHTNNQYSTSYVELYVGDWGDGSPLGRDVYKFAGIDISDGGSPRAKPSDKNWTFNVYLEFYSEESNIQTEGLSRMLQLVTGSSTAHFNESNITLQPMSSASAEFGNAVAPGSVTVDAVNDEIEMVFTMDGNTNPGSWTHTRVKHNNGSSVQNIRSGGCRDDDTPCGTKAAGDKWTYEYYLEFSEGSE